MLDLDDGLLPAWLQPFSTGVVEREAAIRAGARSLVGSSAAELLDLVLVAHREPVEAAARRIRDAVAEHDEQFAGRSHDAQTHVAAAWVVAEVLAGDDARLAVLVALAVASAAFLGLEPRGAGLTNLAASALREHQNRERARESLRSPASAKLPDLTVLDGETGITVSALKELLQPMRTAAVSQQRSLSAMVRVLTERLRAADEELDLLWWSYVGRYEVDGPTWRELHEAASVLAGLNFARLTAFTTPLASCRELLSRALESSPKTSLENAVRQARPHLDVIEPVSHTLMPVLTALSAFDGDNSAPEPSTEPQSDGAVALEPAELAVQALREELMRRLL